MKQKSGIAFLLLAALLLSLPPCPASAGATPSAEGRAKDLALGVTDVQATTEYSYDYAACRAVDGVRYDKSMRFPNWVSNNSSRGVLSFYWDEPVTIAKIRLYGTTDRAARVIEGSISFGDGTEIELERFATDGRPKEIELETPVTVTEADLCLSGSTANRLVGLGEVEFLNVSGENVASLAEVEADSELPDGSAWYAPPDWVGWYAAENVINGWADYTLPKGTFEDEWASFGETYPEIVLIWDEPVEIGTVALCDRVNPSDHVLGGTLTFDDGKSVPFGALDNNGEPLYIDIADVRTTTLTVSVDAASGPNLGFAEIEVYKEHFDVDGQVIVPKVEEPEESEDSEMPEEDDSGEPGYPEGEEEPAVESKPPSYGSISAAILVLFAFSAAASVMSVVLPARKKGTVS